MRELSLQQMVLAACVLTVVMEAVTALLRFGCGLKASEATASTLGRMTGGLRIHHGYLGILCVVSSLFAWAKFPAFSSWLLPIGVALLLSDALHHFVVLRVVVGSSEFHLRYPE